MLMFSKTASKIRIVACLVFIVTFTVFLPALQNDFVDWDDGNYVYDNPNIQSIDSEFINWMFSFQDTLWVPVTRLSHALIYSVWELDPFGHHLANVILHSLNAFLVVIIVAGIMGIVQVKRDSAISDNGKVLIRSILITAGVTGLLFGIHPLRVESVAWVTERKDVLSIFFVLLSLLHYVKYLKDSGSGKRTCYYVLALVFFLMAFMSKPIAVVLPLILVLIDIYPFERITSTRDKDKRNKALIEKIPFFVMGIIFVAVTVLSNATIREEVPLSSYLVFSERLLLAVRAICFYLYKLLLPINLAPFYAYTGKINIMNPDIILSFVFVTAITLFCVMSWRKNKIWLTVWMFFIITLLPVLGIVKIGYYAAADRYTYLPGTGIMLLFGLSAAYLWEILGAGQKLNLKRGVLAAVLLIVFVSLSALTVKQTGIWKNSLALWNAELRLFPVYSVYNSRGKAYSNQGDHPLAIADFKKAIELNPSFTDAHINLGISYAGSADCRRAIESFNTAVMQVPDRIKVYYNRGICYKSLGMHEAAIEDFARVIGSDLEDRSVIAMALLNRGALLARPGMYQRAIDDFKHVVELDPGSALAYRNMAALYEMTGNLPAAIENYGKLIKLKPKYSKAYSNLGSAYAELGKYEKALENYSAAIKINPSDNISYYNRGHVYLRIGERQRAMDDIKAAAKMGNANARNYIENEN